MHVILNNDDDDVHDDDDDDDDDDDVDEVNSVSLIAEVNELPVSGKLGFLYYVHLLTAGNLSRVCLCVSVCQRSTDIRNYEGELRDAGFQIYLLAGCLQETRLLLDLSTNHKLSRNLTPFPNCNNSWS